MAHTKQTARKSTGGLQPTRQLATISKRSKPPAKPMYVRQMARKSSTLPTPNSQNTSRRVHKVKREVETLEPRFTRLSLRKTTIERNRVEPSTSNETNGDVKGNIKKSEK